jgi:MFS family permease
VPRLRRARRSVATYFFIYGCVLATWVSRLPGIKHHLDLNTAQLGLALVGSPLGLILAMRLVPGLVERWSSATLTRAAAGASCICIPLLALAWSLESLLGLLLLFGLTMGAFDISMNTQGVAVERGFGRPVMSSLHGFYSIGVLVGALCGSIAAHADVSPWAHFAIAGACLAILGVAASQSLLGDEADVENTERFGLEETSSLAVPLAARRFLMVVGFIAFCSLFAEGAVDDWSGVYLHEVQRASFGIAPLGAGACAAGMAVGRFCGDPVIARYGRKATLWRAPLVAVTGMSIAVLAPTLTVAIIGYGILGLGVATIIPMAFTLAGNTNNVPPAWALARVTTLGYAGLFGSPVLIGFIAHATSLTVALWTVVVLLLLIAPMSRAVRPKEHTVRE